MKYRGITPVGHKWQAQAGGRHDKVYLGLHDTPEAAAAAWDDHMWRSGRFFVANFPAPTDRGRIRLSSGQVALIDPEDFERVYHAGPWRSVNGYARNGNGVLMHRLVMRATPGTIVDHIDRKRLHNRRENLRFTDPVGSARNRGGSKHNRSGLKGVSWDSRDQKWGVTIEVNGRTRRIGRFHDWEEAGRAYDEAALRLHGEHACTNVELGLPERKN
jgi:hypothetical protein